MISSVVSLPDKVSTSQLPHSNGGNDLGDPMSGQSAGPYTRIYSPEHKPIPMEGVITKSSTIDQSSQHLT